MMSPTADEAYEHDACSPAAAAAARSRLRAMNESSTSVNNFSRPRLVRVVAGTNAGSRESSMPALELENIPGEPLAPPDMYHSMYHEALQPYNYSSTIHV
jgi:hypothetical protein